MNANERRFCKFIRKIKINQNGTTCHTELDSASLVTIFNEIRKRVRNDILREYRKF